MVNRHHKTGGLLPVLAFDPESRLFFCDDQTLGFGFLCQPMAGGDEKTENRLRVLLDEDWPAGTILSFCLAASPNIVPYVCAMRRAHTGGGDDLLRQAVHERAGFLLRGAEQPMAATGGYVRDFQLIITAKLPIEGGRMPSDRDLETIGAFQRRTDQSLRDVGLVPQRLDPSLYITVMGALLNPGVHASWRHKGHLEARDDALLSEQLFDHDVEVRHDRDGIWLGDSRIRLLSVKTFPPQVNFGQVGYLIGDLFSGTRGLSYPFLMTVNLYYPDQQAIRGTLGAKRQWTANMAYGPLIKWVPALALRKRDYDVLFTSLDNGHKAVKLTGSLAIYADSEEQAQSRVAAAINYWAEQGFILLPDQFITLAVFLNNLPFGADRHVVKDLGRYRTMTTEHATRLLPVFSDWKGTGSPALTLVSRSGQLMALDLFDSQTNYNAVIAAQSGSGKSFLANDLIYSYRAAGAQVWVIDIGRSYEKLVETLGGDFVEFDKGNAVGLNPFPLVEDYDDEADMLEGLLAAMAAPTERLSDLQRSNLGRAIRETFRRHGRDTTIDLIAEALGQHPDQRVKDIADQLYPFTSTGSYGAYFAGPNTVSFQNDLTVLELEHLRQRKHLQKVVLLQLIYQIQQTMYLGARGRRKIVLIDEAWDLLTDGDVGKFIEHGYRRFRKYGGAAIALTQSLEDLHGSEVGRAIADNSANMFLLAQKTETITQLAKAGRLPMSHYAGELLKTVHTATGRYSEIYCATDTGSGVGRLIVSPFLQLLYSTRPTDIEALEHYRSQGLSVRDAVNAVLRARHIQPERRAA